MSFNGKFVLNMIQFAEQQGANGPTLLALTHKTPQELCDDSCIITDSVYNNVIEKGIELTKDPYFGLHAGESLNLAAAGLIGQITQTSETVKEAIEFCCEFANLGCSSLPMSLSEEEECYKVKITPNIPWMMSSHDAYQQTTDGVLAFTIKELQSLTHHTYHPMAIHLPWTKPVDTSEYDRVLGSAILFDSHEIAILLHKKQVEAKVVNADYDLLRILVAHAQEKSNRIEGQRDFSTVVKQSVLKLIKPEFPTIKQVAGHLNISSRTLQRKLNEEGVTFQNLLNELRFDLAKDYLKRDDLSIKEIAYLLSYSDASAFIRSFKRWSGTTPNQFKTNY